MIKHFFHQSVFKIIIYLFVFLNSLTTELGGASSTLTSAMTCLRIDSRLECIFCPQYCWKYRSNFQLEVSSTNPEDESNFWILLRNKKIVHWYNYPNSYIKAKNTFILVYSICIMLPDLFTNNLFGRYKCKTITVRLRRLLKGIFAEHLGIITL